MAETPINVNNVVKGPWSRAKVVNPSETDIFSDDMFFIDEVAENIMIQAIHNLSENGVDIKNSQFISEIGFLNEIIKSIMYRTLNYQHPMHQLIHSMMKIETEKPLQTFSTVDYEMLAKLIQTTYNIPTDDKDDKE